MPTFAPWAERANAKFAVAVDLPTPPLPEAIAMIFFTLGKVCIPVWTLCDWTLVDIFIFI